MTFDILIAGVGGQGTVLASKLIAAAAIKCGFDARTTETIGMAQRGGSVTGHTRIGDNIHSPMIRLGGADLLIAFEPAEAVRQLPFLSQGGTLVVFDVAVRPAAGASKENAAPGNDAQSIGRHLKDGYDADEMIGYIRANVPKHIIVPGMQIKQRYAKMINTALLGAAARSGLFPFGAEILKETISEMPRFRDENLAAFELGGELTDVPAR